MGFVTKEHILQGISIIDIADEYGIALESAASSNFDHRCRCPSKNHKNGNERTGSLYIDSQNNNFYCFGCSANSNVIDFYMLCTGYDFSRAMSELRKRIDPSKVKNTSPIRKGNNFSVLLELSNLLRRTMLTHPEDLRWISSIMERADEYITTFKTTDVNKAKGLYSKIKKLIEERYNN